MFIQYNPKTSIGCSSVVVIIALITTYVITSTLNPLEVYRSGSVLGMFVVSLAALNVLGSSLMLIQSTMMRKMIRATTGQDPDDVRCPGCGEPLLKLMGTYGQLIRCPNPRCGKWWHNGPRCYSKGLPKVVRVPFGTMCPECRGRDSTPEDDLLKELRRGLDRF